MKDDGKALSIIAALAILMACGIGIYADTLKAQMAASKGEPPRWAGKCFVLKNGEKSNITGCLDPECKTFAYLECRSE